MEPATSRLAYPQIFNQEYPSRPAVAYDERRCAIARIVPLLLTFSLSALCRCAFAPCCDTAPSEIYFARRRKTRRQVAVMLSWINKMTYPYCLRRAWRPYLEHNDVTSWTKRKPDHEIDQKLSSCNKLERFSERKNALSFVHIWGVSEGSDVSSIDPFIIEVKFAPRN